jgi:hypothetical protein
VIRENKSTSDSHYLSTACDWRLGNAKANTARLRPSRPRFRRVALRRYEQTRSFPHRQKAASALENRFGLIQKVLRESKSFVHHAHFCRRPKRFGNDP